CIIAAGNGRLSVTSASDIVKSSRVFNGAPALHRRIHAGTRAVARASLRPDAPSRATHAGGTPERAPSVLNVGGASKQIPIPGHYDGWHQWLLEITPASGADLVCDARDLGTLDAEQFDAVCC